MTAPDAVVVSLWGDELGTITTPQQRWVEADFRSWAESVSTDVVESGLHPLKCWGSTGLTRAQWGALLRKGAQIDRRVASALEEDDDEDVGALTEFEVNCLRMYVQVMRVYSGVEMLAGTVVKEKMLDGSLAAVAAWRDHAAKEEALMEPAVTADATNSWGAPQAMAAVLGVFLPAATQQSATPQHRDSIEVGGVEVD